MADMARTRSAHHVLDRSRADGRHRLGGSDGRRSRRSSRSPTSTLPAAIKAFCGEHGGVVCTSSNAAATLKWAWERGERVLFLPDQHLGRNTAYKMGVPLDEMVRVGSRTRSGAAWSPDSGEARAHASSGRATARCMRASRSGRSSSIRAQHPGVRVIVHPEVPWDVVQAADDSGSTEYIINQVEPSPAGSVWAVGTEVHLVNRLAERGRARPDGAVARSVRLPVLDDVPRVAEPPALDPRGARRRARSTTGSWSRTIRSTGRKSRSTGCSTDPTVRPFRLPPFPVPKYDPKVLQLTRTTGGLSMAHTLPPLPYPTTRSNRTSTSRRWRSITGSTTRPTSTT